MNVTKRNVVMRVADKLVFRQVDVQAVIDEFLSYMERALSEGADIELRGFGSFRVMRRGPRKGRNPRKPSSLVDVPELFWVRFQAGASLRNKLKKLNSKKK